MSMIFVNDKRILLACGFGVSTVHEGAAVFERNRIAPSRVRRDRPPFSPSVGRLLPSSFFVCSSVDSF